MNKPFIVAILILISIIMGNIGYTLGILRRNVIITERTKILPQALSPGLGVSLSNDEMCIIKQMTRSAVAPDGSFEIMIQVRPRTDDEERLNGKSQPYGTYEERMRAVTNECIKYMKGEVDHFQGPPTTVAGLQGHD